ncbi:hypothetical protein DFH09DRAFT_1311435 [Mycena vulgaris]|nr:hypothetical protein DFH09DRAFT_1311435 [Mycena vulgaris]
MLTLCALRSIKLARFAKKPLIWPHCAELRALERASIAMIREASDADFDFDVTERRPRGCAPERRGHGPWHDVAGHGARQQLLLDVHHAERRMRSSTTFTSRCAMRAGTRCHLGRLRHRDWVTSVAFSPDESYIVSGSRDRTIRVWNAQTGSLVAGPFYSHSSFVNLVAFSPDGTRVASGSRDKTIRMWEMGECLNGSVEDDIRLEDGWMMTSSSVRLFWVPPWLRQGLYFPRNSTVISSKEGTKLDLRRFVHGNSWQDCKGDPGGA